MNRMRGRRFKVIFILAAIGSCFFLYLSDAQAGDADPPRHVVGGYFVYGNAHDKDIDYDFVSINPYFGWLLTPADERFTLEFAVEGFYNRHLYNFDSKYEIGVRPILRLHYLYGHRISPFFEISTAGVLYTNLKVRETGSELNFTSHIGAGVDVRLWDEWYLNMAYRYRHVSNAGLDGDNAGLNHHQGLMGLSYHF